MINESSKLKKFIKKSTFKCGLSIKQLFLFYNASYFNNLNKQQQKYLSLISSFTLYLNKKESITKL